MKEERIWIVWSSQYDDRFAQVVVAKRTDKCVYLKAEPPGLYKSRLLVGDFTEVSGEKEARNIVCAKIMGRARALLKEAEEMRTKAEAIRDGCELNSWGEPVLPKKGKKS
ncbi:MAG: hypothetical protein ACYDH4_09605 [Candidatus Cryosericum sp.]